jgi:thiamine biosynthesis lipoprotein
MASLAADPASTLLALGLEGLEPAAATGESVRVDRSTYRSWSVRPSMGTLVSVVALDASRERVEDAIEQAFAEMARLVALLGRHDSSSPVAELNARGRMSDAPPELLTLLQRARRLYFVTRGVFDVTVQPLVDLFRATRGAPKPIEWVEAVGLVGLDRLRVAGRTLSFDRSGMGLTLDGIAKGFVVDRMAETLAGRGVHRFLINAGGDIRARGGKEGGQPWQVGVRDPRDPDTLLEVVTLRDGAIATSGNYERAVAHIVDGRGGWASHASASASVSAPDATAADALATALFVLGPTQGPALMDVLSRCAGMIVDVRGRALRSQRWQGAASKGVKHES